MANQSNLRGERENRRTKRGIRKGRLRASVAKRPKHSDPRGFFQQGRKQGKHLKSTETRLYRGR